MAVTYDKISFTLIEKGLKDHINDEFMNVYVAPRFTMKGSECIRIDLQGSDNLETSNAYEQRTYNVIVRYYLKAKLTDERINESIKAKIDKLKKHILDKQVNTTSWVELTIESINYNIQDDENEEDENLYIAEFELSLINHNPFA
jgi:hypothetical protein